MDRTKKIVITIIVLAVVAGAMLWMNGGGETGEEQPVINEPTTETNNPPPEQTPIVEETIKEPEEPKEQLGAVYACGAGKCSDSGLVDCQDGVCSAGESPTSCHRDCMPACGDGFCDLNATTGPYPENFQLCSSDCGKVPCGDGVCEQYETKDGCPADCK